MTVARETVFDALLAQLATSGATFKTYARRWHYAWEDDQEQLLAMPLLMQIDQTESVTYTNRGIGSVQVWSVNVVVYARKPDGETPGTPDVNTAGSSVINPLVDAVFNALAPTGPDGVQTLGGVVLDCRIEAQIEKAYGDVDPSGICSAIIPISILVNP